MLIFFIIGLILVPLIIGTAITTTLYEDRIVQGFVNYLIGFSVVLCLFTLYFYYFLWAEGSFWILSVYFTFTLMLVTALCLVRVYAIRGRLMGKKDQRDSGAIEDSLGSIVLKATGTGQWKERWILVLALALILFVLFRGFFLRGFSFRDDRTYIPLINDILHTGILNGKQGVSGAYYTGLPYYAQAGYKFALSSWYAFEAWCAQMSGLHPLLLCHRLFPLVFPSFYYMVMWILGCSIFQDRKKQYWFLLFSVLLNELWNIPPQQQILLVWPSWGKNLTAAVYVPLIMTLYLRYLEQSGWKRVLLMLLLMMLTLAACATSAMGAFMIPLELGLMSVLMTIRRRRFRILPETAVMILPAAALLLAYIRYF